MARDPYPHLRSVDAEAWPGVARVPEGTLLKAMARRAEANFARACHRAGIELDGEDPDLRIQYDALFLRIADSGWLGLAESYMAGEWSTPDSSRLVQVLQKLIDVGYAPRAKRLKPSASLPGELPVDLVRLYSGDGLSHSGGIFASGVPTTVRESVESYSTGRGEPKTHFVDYTSVSEPGEVTRDDLADAQRRAAGWLLDAAGVNHGTHLLVYPANGLQAAILATQRRATVDILTSDSEQYSDLEETLVLEGAEDSTHVALVDVPVPGPSQWRGRYDAIISIDKLETTSGSERRAFVGLLDRLLSNGGRAVFQSLVATENLSSAARDATDVLRAYVWPGLDYPTTKDVHSVIDKHSSLRVIAETHFGAHYAASIKQQRSFFDGHLREAAAAGFDQVFRRLWTFQFALREALLNAEMVDAVTFTATHRNRGGRR